MSGVLVIKLGGTSLGSAARIRLAARRLRAHARAGRRVVAVVSAAGGATDRIARMLAAVSAGRPHPREADRALATGEDLSAPLLASALAALGIPARSLRGGEAGVRVEGGFCGGRIARIDPAPLRTLLEAGVVPVVSGFQGARADGETVTLGRGASDLSAVAIAAALGAAECHIVTDVAGVFDRDPRVDAAARLLARLTHGELLRLSVDGARVVHPEAAREAQRSAVPLRIHHFRAPFDGEHGTIVTATPRPPRSAVFRQSPPPSPASAEIPSRESAQADFGPLLPRIHSPVPALSALPAEEVAA
jgi:aspartate kinase